jgi:hypothetical protein
LKQTTIPDLKNVKTKEEERLNLYLIACMISFLFFPLSCCHLYIIVTGPDVKIAAE